MIAMSTDQRVHAHEAAPAATVIICVYNRGPLAVQCAYTLLAMDCQDFEILFVDDGSTDDTRSILEGFQAEHAPDRIRIVAHPRNLGVSAARNTGIDAARGRFIFFTDSDCTADPAWLGRMLEAFRDPRVAAVAGSVVDAFPRTWAERAQAGSSRIGHAAWQRRTLVGNNMGFRADVLRRYHFDGAMSYYCDDDELAWRLHGDGHHVQFVPDAQVHHDHSYTLGKYLRKALRQGEGSARLWYKHNVFVGRDLWLPAAALAALPVALLGLHWLLLPAALLLLHVIALAFNERVYKGKGFGAVLAVLPLEMTYSALKGYSVLRTLVRIALGREPSIRRSKTQWKQRPRHLQCAA